MNTKKAAAETNRLKSGKAVTVSIELEETLLLELKKVAVKRGISRRDLMRILIADGFKRLKKGNASK